MFGATFNLVISVGVPYFSGTLKDDSLSINSLALNNNFSYRNVFQNGVNSLSRMVITNPAFGQKAQKFV